MSKTINEIAKELGMSSEEISEKANFMGIEVFNGSIEDIDAVALKNTVLHSKKKTETKIVKVEPKKTEKKTEEKEEVKISVKQANVNQVRANIKEPKVRGTEKGDSGSRAKPPQGAPQPRASVSNAPSGVPQPKPAQKTAEQGAGKSSQPPTGTPMPKAAVPPAEKAAPEAAKQGEDIGKTEAVKKPAPVKSEQSASAEKPVRQAPDTSPSQPAASAAAEKPAPKAPAAVEDNVRRPNLPRGPVIVKRAEEVAAEDAARKAASEKAAQARKEQQQAAAASGARRQSSDNRGPRQPRDGQGQGSRDNRDRGPRQNSDSRGPRQAGDNRGPRPAGDNRGPRPGGDNRGGRPGGDDRSRPAGDRPQKPKTSGSGGDVDVKPTRKNDGKKAVKKDRPDSKANKIEKKERGKGLMEKKFIERPAPKKRPKKVEKVVEPEIDTTELPAGTKIINVPITVAGLAEQIEKTSSEIIVALMKLGIMANINQNVDEDTAILLGAELGVNIVVDKVQEEEVEEGLELYEDKEEDLTSRPPIITVMGHVDHGKTSLLDTIRKTSVTDSEAGGITQHIGASEAYVHGQKIVFLDTPGHEAFTTMRARGAHVTDIAILVVAADDSVKPQTIEAISHAKAAGVPIIVAVNKIDKPGANPDRVKQDLTEHGILVEDWGGDTICVPVSAKTGEGIESLLEMVLLQAEVLELKANPNRLAMGTVIEARLDKAKGPVATLLVLNGTLKTGMSVVAGTSSGRIRAMTNYKGDSIHKAGPATAVEILGLTDVPEAGDEFNAVKEDRIAREIAESRKDKQREEVLARNSSVTLEQLFSQIQEGEVKELNLIVKGDVQGSVGAVTQSLEKLTNENVRVKIIHTGVGTVTESDVMLASTSGAIIIGFNVRPSTVITNMAERENVEIRPYRIIYEIIDDVEAAMKGMLDPIFKEVVMGKVEIRETFKVPNIGVIGGAYVLEGKVQRHAQVRLVRDGIIIHEGKISSLKRFKDDVKEVASNYECGIGIENYNDIKEGDIIEAFMMEEIERK